MCAKQGLLDDACDATNSCSLSFGFECSNVTGKCVALAPLGKPGDACVADSAHTKPPTLCGAKGTCTNKTCTAALANGAACDSQSGPRCWTGSVCENGVCNVPDPSMCK
jgi:hypothetical protein